jgi:hypothetical protein
VAKLDWYTFDEGVTLGTEGSECGTIVSDEEHALGARLTLERGTQIAPFAITCGVYGWLVHTRFFQSEIEAHADYDRMKIALAELLDRAPRDGRDAASFTDSISDFVAAYP